MNAITLDDVCELIVDCEHKTAPKAESGYPSIRTPNIGRGYFILDGVNRVSRETYEKWTQRAVPQYGDLIIAREAPVGNVAMIPKGLDVCLGQRTVLIRPDQTKADPRFLTYLLLSDEVQGSIQSHTNGATVAHLNMRDIRGLKIPFLPDLPTQRKIAGILSAYDDLIENNLRRIKILEEMAQSLYREWFVHFRFPGHESVTFIDSPLGQIPKGWNVKAIGDLGKVVTGKTPSKSNEDFFGEDIPFLKTPDMHGQMFILRTNENLSTAGAQSQSNKTLPAGSICVSCIGTIGVVSITTAPCQTNQQINSVVLGDEVIREFLFFWLREAKQLMENLGSNGATMGNVNKSKFEGMQLVCPPSDLLARFHSATEPTFEQIERLFRKINTLRRTRDLLLPKLLSCADS
jgi:type I restriction enzyme S subunit